MIGKQGKHFTTATFFKKVCKTLFVTVTILSPNFLLNNCCIKIMVDTVKLWKTFTWRRWYFYTISATERSRFPIQIFNTLLFCSTYVTLRHHVDVKTSSALLVPYMENRAKVYLRVTNVMFIVTYYTLPPRDSTAVSFNGFHVKTAAWLITPLMNMPLVSTTYRLTQTSIIRSVCLFTTLFAQWGTVQDSPPVAALNTSGPNNVHSYARMLWNKCVNNATGACKS